MDSKGRKKQQEKGKALKLKRGKKKKKKKKKERDNTLNLLLKSSFKDDSHTNNKLLQIHGPTPISIKDLPERGNNGLADSLLIEIEGDKVALRVADRGAGDLPNIVQQPSLLHCLPERPPVQLPAMVVLLKYPCQAVLVPCPIRWYCIVFNLMAFSF